jgi:alpha-mannosidase
MSLRSVALAVSALLLASLSDAAATTPENTADVVWRIGTFDASSAEFSGDTPSHPVVYQPGTSQPGDWPSFAPALFPHAKEDPATAPRTIQFNLDQPAPAWRLRVSLIIERSSVPALRVIVNRHSGTYYLHPRLDFSMGDNMDAFFPAYSQATVDVDLPGNALQPGVNTIALQAVATADAGVPDAGFNYDAIELDRLSALSGRLTASMEPTIFYVRDGNALREKVDVFLRSPDALGSGGADLEIAGQHYYQPIASSDSFGEVRLRFSVAEFPAGTPAHLSIHIGDRTDRFTQTLEPQKKWTLYVVPHVHLDVGYTDYQAKVTVIQSRIFDEAMNLVAKHPDFRFSTDGEWNLEQFLHTRTPAEQQRLIHAIQQKQIFIPAQASNLLTGFPTAETLIRSLYPSADFSRRYGTPFDYANITDVPSYSWSYASILASAGIHDFLAASNNDRAPVLLQGHLNENSPMHWEGPDGQQVLFWYSRHYMQMQFLFGLPPHPETGEELLPLFLQMYDHPSYHSSDAMIFGTQVENTDLYPQQAELADQWNQLYAFPHLQYSGFHEALTAIAQQFGDNVPTIRGDGGPYWEDGMGADAFYAAMERRNESRAPSAEKFSTLSTLVDPRLAVDRDALRRMWDDMVLMDEHTWLSWNSISDPASREAIDQLKVKDSRAIDAAALCDHLLRSSMASLADSIDAGPGSIIVFNSLGWKRSGPVRVDLDNGQEIVDRVTSEPVPFSVLRSGENSRYVEFMAADVPAAGYKVYSLRTAQPAQPAPTSSSSTTLESPFYRVELDPSTGAIRSIYDKQLQKELVSQNSPYRFGQYLYVSGGDKGPNSIQTFRVVSPRPQLQIHPAEKGHLLSVERTPWGWRAQMESSAANTPVIHAEILLFDQEKKIELIENLTKNSALQKEAVYFAFPFAMDRPQFQYEIQNGVVDPAHDMYPGAGHEWFSAQHWVSVQQNGVSGTVMPLDASLVTLGDINRGAWPTTFGDRPGTIFSYVMNNYWNTNYRAEQGGEFTFRYVITSAASTDPASLSHAGWEEVTPLEQDEIQPQDKALDLPRPLSGKQASFLQIDDPGVLLDTWKPAEDGNGDMLRLIDLGGTARIITLSTPLLSLDTAMRTDAVENNLAPLPLTSPHTIQVSLRPHEILTLRLVFRTPALLPESSESP